MEYIILTMMLKIGKHVRFSADGYVQKQWLITIYKACTTEDFPIGAARGIIGEWVDVRPFSG